MARYTNPRKTWKTWQYLKEFKHRGLPFNPLMQLKHSLNQFKVLHLPARLFQPLFSQPMAIGSPTEWRIWNRRRRR